MVQHKTAIVVGAGIVGLATARALALKGCNVTVIEKSTKAVGASVRNFGMLWPVGQPDGVLYNRAIRSKNIWKEIADAAGIWYDELGSLHVAYHADEWLVLQELAAAFSQSGRPVSLLSPDAILQQYKGIQPKGLLGGLYSSTETIVDPRDAIAQIPSFLESKLGVHFIWGRAVSRIQTGRVWIGNQILEADVVCVCTGSDFETLYPELFQQQAITKSKLQMMRFAAPIPQYHMGVSLCGGLSLIHYNSFKVAPSLSILKDRYHSEMPDYIKWGIHVMLSQNNQFEITVGDSHEYGLTFDPFDKAHINELILSYLNQFAITDGWKLLQSWHGIYPKMTDGTSDLFLSAEKDVYILNGIGGAGMTLSFGFAEEKINSIGL